MDALAYLLRLYAQCNQSPCPRAATEIARMEREMREYVDGVGDLPLVPVPAILH